MVDTMQHECFREIDFNFKPKMLERIAVVVLGLTLVHAGLESEWAEYKKAHGKVYSRVENDFRRNIWQKKMVEIATHNVQFYSAESSYMLGANKFTDMTPQERDQYAMQELHAHTNYSGKHEEEKAFESDLPKEVDWRDKGYVTPVKNQAGCGSCWAFSAVGAIEGQHFHATGKLVSLSESNLVDCCHKGCWGCHGSWPHDAMQYVIDNKGIDTEKSYPYVPKNEKCAYKEADVGATISSYVTLPFGSERALQKATAEIGPISVCIRTGRYFYEYKTGVYDNPHCGGGVNHAVLVVGYGNEEGKDYWLVKNSYGAKWGDHGYIKMRRNRNNQCGIANAALYPIV